MTRQQFYKSKEWRDVRDFVRKRDKMKCQMCGKQVNGTPVTLKNGYVYTRYGIVDHIIELTDENINKPEISLNPDNCRLLHHECHELRHARFHKESMVDEGFEYDFKKRDKDEIRITIFD